MIEPGTVVGRYVVEDLVGEGWGALVYRAREPQMGRTVALKVMLPHEASAIDRLKSEIRAIDRIRHPDIVSLYESGETDDGLLYLALEWMEGGSLADLLARRDQLPWQEAIYIAEVLADALAYAHSIGFLHRDIKPQNVLLRSDGRPKLADFGVAGVLRKSLDHREGVTQAGIVVGTPRYMAPEQLRGQSNSPATDVFGLGLVMYEMLYGAIPGARSVLELISQRMTGDIEVPDRGDVPPELAALLRRMLKRDEKDRPATAREVVRSLSSIRAGAGKVGGYGLSPASASVESAAAPARPVAHVPSDPPEWEKPHSSGSFDPRFGREPEAASGEATRAEAATAGLSTGKLHVPASPPVAHRSRTPLPPLVIGVVGTVLILIVWGIVGPVLSTGSPPGPGIREGIGWSLIQGFLLIGAGLIGGRVASRALVRRRSMLDREAGLLLAGTRDRSALTRTIAFRVDELIARTQAIDAQVLGATIVQMVHEYDRAKASSDRQAALMNTAQLLEKLMVRLSPWYVRHDKAIAVAVSAVGVVAGVVKIATDVVALLGAS